MSDPTENDNTPLDITTLSADELRAELDDVRKLRVIRLREGNTKLVEFHTGVIERIRAELKRREKQF